MTAAVHDTELELLLEGIFRLYGYDFREYARGTLTRRVAALVAEEGLESVSELQGRLFRNPELLHRLMSGLSIRTSGFFRDPGFYRAFRDKATPLLRTYPFVRIWHAGCATGEEAYSLAILMAEEGLLERCAFYATDVSAPALEVGQPGVYHPDVVRMSESAYLESGGKSALSDYFDGEGRVTRRIRQRVSFMRHNLVTDGSFNEFNVIFCRNVLIYFSKALQDRVHDLLYDSLTHFGILGLGANETVQLTKREKHFRALDERNKLYRRID